MIIPDVNLLIYAYNDQDARHQAAKIWWESCLNGTVPVGLPWIVSAGFIRIITHPRVLRNPLSNLEATTIVKSWLDQPCVRIPHPGPDHAELFFRFLDEIGTSGNLTTDAQIAALSVEHQAILYSNDTDFARFTGLRWKNPLKHK